MKRIALAGAMFLASPAWAAQSETARIADRARGVTIMRDHLGIAHVRGKTDADAVFGMAYAQAEDDFNRVETNYLTSLGRLAEAEGGEALWKDLRQRLWVDEARLKADYARSPSWLRALMDGWADGLNHFLASNPQVKPRVLMRFEPWMALSFSEGSIGGDIENVSLDGLKALYGAPVVAAAPGPRAEPQGSNGIAIGPKRSANGKALLLINPHTSFFFRDVVQVTSGEGLNVYGAVTWGQFFVYQGFNAHAGWMHTSSGLDNRDEFAETVVSLPGGGHGYRYGKDVRPLEARPLEIRVRGADGALATRRFVTWHSHHGPIVRADKGKWIAYAILDNPTAALEQSFLRTKAKSLAEFMAVAERKANSSNNTLFADAAGRIAYLHPQFVPARDDRFDYRGAVDGSDPATDWKGLHSVASLPNVIDPAAGYAFNVNDAPWPAAGKGTLKAAAYPRYMDQWGWNARTDHALAVLGGARKFTTETLRAAAYDTALPGFDRILPRLLASYEKLARNDPRHSRLAGPIGLLLGWNRRWSKDSMAQSLAIHWGEALWAGVMGSDRPTNGDEVAYARMALAPADQHLAALEAAIAKMRALYGGWRVPWGTINRFQRNDGAIVQTFDDRKPSIGVGFPGADWGTLASFGARTYPGTVKRYGTSGNSFVAVVEFGKGAPRAFAVTAGGVNGDPASPHFIDQAAAYAEGRLLPVPFTEAEVEAATRERYHPGEARKARSRSAAGASRAAGRLLTHVADVAAAASGRFSR